MMNSISRKTNRLSILSALLLVFLMTVSLLFAGCGSSEDNSSEVTSAGTSALNSGSESGELSSESVSGDSSDETDASYADSSEIAESSVSEESGSDSSGSEASGNESSEPETSGGDSSGSEVSNDPDENLVGTGTKDDPYLTSPNEDLKLETVSIPAGKSVYYGIYRIGDTFLTIESKNVFVVYNNQKYTPKNGKIVIYIENILASNPVDFEIGNTGSKDASFILTFTVPEGSQGNPEKVGNITENHKVSLEEGNDLGYNYVYTAEKSGSLRLYMTATADSILIVTNNRNSAQRTTESDPETDENGQVYVKIDVEKGDELIINVAAIPNKRGKIPASEITWSGKYN